MKKIMIAAVAMGLTFAANTASAHSGSVYKSFTQSSVLNLSYAKQQAALKGLTWHSINYGSGNVKTQVTSFNCGGSECLVTYRIYH